jgi:hypothetical protein
MNTVEKKRQFIKDVSGGKKRFEDFNLETFEEKKLSLEMVSNDDLERLIGLYSKYSSQVKNGVLCTSVLTAGDLMKFKEVEKQFTYE